MFSSRSAVLTRFPVDYVKAEKTRLDQVQLQSALRRSLKRDLVFTPFAERKVVSEFTGANALVAAIHLAFSHHLPLMLSPDVIWLTLAQGFANHVNENPEALRHRLVKHDGKQTLAQEIASRSAEEWEKAVAGFSAQIRAATDPAIHDALVCDFTTTTPEAKTASEIALMDTYSPYFDYEVMECICGIPSISLTGMVADWEKIRDRAEIFEAFGLDWWLRRLRPILDQFVAAARGHADREFWRAMYKYQPPDRLYARDKVTGWISCLFPYLGDLRPRSRNQAVERGMDTDLGLCSFPQGFCSVPIILTTVLAGGMVVGRQELELVGGLSGVAWNSADASLTPDIAWCIAQPAPKAASRS